MAAILPKLLAILAAFNVGHAKSGRKFFHISDVHVDEFYSSNGDESHMCHFHNGTVSKFGSYKCESPKILVEAAIKRMKEVEPNPDFILWTGDNTAHGNNMTWPVVMRSLTFVVRLLHQHFPDVPVIPVLGNHDSYPVDYFPQGGSQYSDYLTKGSLGDLLGSRSTASEKFKECGFYIRRNTSYVNNMTQTFIALNTNLYYNNKAINDKTIKDPCGQLDWLDKEFKNSRPDERIFILGHVPPGFFEQDVNNPFFENEDITKTYLDIVTEESNAKKIVAHFYGHTHTDSFRLFMNSDDQPVGVGFITPSLTPLLFIKNGVNPSFRLYDYDPMERKILTYNQYYLPLNKVVSADKVDAKVSPTSRNFNKVNTKVQPTSHNVDNADAKVAPRSRSLDKVDARVPPTSRNVDRRMRNSKFLGKRSADNVDTITPVGENVDQNEDTTLAENIAAQATEKSVADNEETVTTTEVVDKVGGKRVGEIDDKSKVNDTKVADRSTTMSGDSSTKLADKNATDENETSTESNLADKPEEADEVNESVDKDDDNSVDVGTESTSTTDNADEDKDVNYLVDMWKNYYSAALDFEIASFSLDDTYDLYMKMSKNPDGVEFNAFMRHAFVYRQKDADIDCGEKCHGRIMCALVHMTSVGMENCLDKMAPTTQEPTSTLPTTLPTSVATTVINAGAPGKEEHVGVGEEGHFSKGLAVGLSFVTILFLALAIFMWYRKNKRRRYNSQEFLLDSFRFDGYSQLEQP